MTPRELARLTKIRGFSQTPGRSRANGSGRPAAVKVWTLWMIVGILGIGTISTTLLRRGGQKPDVYTVTVESKPIRMTIETNGTVEPLSKVEVGCEVTGKIIEMPVDNDQPVTKGQVICRIDPELAQAENSQSEADYAKSQSALADAKLAHDEQIANLPVRTKQALAQKQDAEANLVEVEHNWKRIDELYKNNDAMEMEWVLAKARWIRGKAALTSAEAAFKLAQNNEKILVERAGQAVQQAEAALKLAKARLDFTTTRVERCTIKSPIDGVVLKRYLDVGTTVTAAFQTPTLFLLAPSLKRMKVHAKVSESDISHIEVGQTASFTIEAKQSTRFEGQILEKHNQPDIVQNVVTYTVVFEVDNPNSVLIPGLSVNVVVECVSKPAVPQIANSSLRFRPPIAIEERQALVDAAPLPPRPATDAAGSPAIYCAEAHAWAYDEQTRKWNVVRLWVGVTDNVATEILAGAKPGDRFVKRFEAPEAGTFSLKEAIKLARPDNRTL